MPADPYGIIYADPPWSYRDRCVAGERGVEFKYDTMTVEQMCELDVAALAADDCALFMWATWPTLPDALRVMEAWGFRYSTAAFVWVKTRSTKKSETAARRIIRRETKATPHDALATTDRMADAGLLMPSLHWGMGRSTRANTEPCLLGVRGRLGRVDAGVHQVVMSELRRHSEKPPEVRGLIERLMGDRPRLEMFARQRAGGWDAWGNQVPGGNDVEIQMKRQIEMLGGDR